MNKLKEFWMSPTGKKVLFGVSLLAFIVSLHFFVINTNLVTLVLVILSGVWAIRATKQIGSMEKEYMQRKKQNRINDYD